MFQTEVIIVQSVFVTGVKLPDNMYNEGHECSRSLGHEVGMQSNCGMLALLFLLLTD